MSPSGCWVASGDKSGNLRVWACDNPDQILKFEGGMLGGPIIDITWSPDNQRIALSGGTTVPPFGKAIMWDSGNSTGEISGHQKKINSIAFKPTRPFRLATGGEEGIVNHYEGPPFKFKFSPHTHTNFVNTVRFSPDGTSYCSVSNDKKVVIYEGKDGSIQGEAECAKGSIYGAAWSPDGAKIVICSGDKTVRVIDKATVKEVDGSKCYTAGKDMLDMQVGVAWSAHGLLSYSLGGELTLIDPDTMNKTLTQVGHNRSIAGICWSESANVLVSGSYMSVQDSTGTGCMRAWDIKAGTATNFGGSNHSARIVGIGAMGGGAKVASVGIDNKLIFSGFDGSDGTSVALDECPKQGCLGCGTSVAAVIIGDGGKDKVVVTTNEQVTKTCTLGFEGTAAAVDSTDSIVAVGSRDGFVQLYSASMEVSHKLERHKDSVAALAFTKASERLASGCANKEIVIWDPRAGTPLFTGLSGFHNARISVLGWSLEGKLASGGVDGFLLLWDDEFKAPTKIKAAHVGEVTGLAFKANTVISSGGDAAIKVWDWK